MPVVAVAVEEIPIHQDHRPVVAAVARSRQLPPENRDVGGMDTIAASTQVSVDAVVGTQMKAAVVAAVQVRRTVAAAAAVHTKWMIGAVDCMVWGWMIGFDRSVGVFAVGHNLKNIG